MQFQRPAALPGVFFDSDMGVNMDSALALAVLYGASSRIKVIGLAVTNPNLEAAAFCDVVARFYTTGGRLKVTPPLYHFPIGYAGEGAAASASMLSKALAAKADDGSPVFAINVKDLSETAEVQVVLRNALSAQKDGNALMVVTGPATDLIRVLALLGNREMIAAKIGALILGAGDFSGSAVDPRIRADVAAARRVFAEWPTPVVVVGREAGAAVPYPGASIASDFAWATTHPIVEAYRASKPTPYDVPSQAVLAALYATDMKGDLLKLSETGRIEVLDDGRTKFMPSPSGTHRYLLTASDPSLKANVVKAFTTLTSAKPAIPAGRGRGAAAATGQQQPAKPSQP